MFICLYVVYIQLTEGYDAVVADYGFSRHVSDVNSSAKTKSDVGPIKYRYYLLYIVIIPSKYNDWNDLLLLCLFSIVLIVDLFDIYIHIYIYSYIYR